MSPEGPRFPSESKSFESDDEKKNKRTKKGANVRVPAGLVSLEKSLENNDKAKSAELSPIEKALAELAAKRAEKPAEPKEKAAEPVEATVETPDVAETVAEAQSEEAEKPDIEKDKKIEGYEPLPVYEPAPVEFSGGEVVVRLSGEEPVAERVIPLQAGEAAAEKEEDSEPAPVFTPQPLQQHQFRPEQTPAPTTSAETLPPVPVAPAFYHPPAVETAPQQPATVYAPEAIRQRDLAPFGPSSEKPASKQDVEDALYYAEKAGQRRGVLSGLIVGGAYEHFKHKRREKKAEKRFKQQNKQLEQVRKDFAFREQEQTKQVNERDRQYNALEKRLENNVAAEKLSKRNTETLAQGQEPEPLRVPDDHRIETSAWHAIEVDAKTGKAVEKPTFEYGREYYRERAQEAAPINQRHAAAGEVALVAAASAGQSDNGSSPAPTSLPDIPLATTQGPPSSVPKDASQKTAAKAAKPTASTGPIWPWVVALVVIVVLLAVLIH